MSLKDTHKQMRELLSNIVTDLEKAENGNKAASQRVRTGTVRLEKLAKLYRKESITSERKNKGQKKPVTKTASTPAKTTAKSTTSSKAKTAETTASKGKSAGMTSQHGSATNSTKASSAKVKAKPKAKAATASVRPRQLSLKRATAKIPMKRASVR